jgi:hypothetical protein
MFHCLPGSGYNLTIPDSGQYSSFELGIPLYACVCVNCGHTTLRVHPKDMERLRQEAEKKGENQRDFDGSPGDSWVTGQEEIKSAAKMSAIE